MKTKHFDAFNGNGTLGAVSYWTTASPSGGTAAALNLGAGSARAQGAGLDVVAIHGTDGGFQLPASHNVMTNFHIGQGVDYIGVLTMAASSYNVATQVKLIWQDVSAGGNIAQNMVLSVPGFADQTVALNSLTIINLAAIGLDHAIALECDYQAMNNGQPEFIFKGYLNGSLVLTSPPRRLAYWDSTEFHVGILVARHSGSSWPRTLFHDFSTEVPTVAGTHEPMPTMAAAVARTPITIGDEDVTASPYTFPAELRTVEVVHRRHTRKMLTDMGYEVTHPMLSKVRRIFKCSWIGSDSTAASIETFIDNVSGTHEQFNVTIRALGIGDVSCALISFGDFIDVSKNIKRIQFDLVEVY